VLETANFLKHAWLVDLSPQNFIDCTPHHNCSGGNVDDAWNFAMAQGGLALESVYPFVLGTGEPQANPCQISDPTLTVKVNSQAEADAVISANPQPPTGPPGAPPPESPAGGVTLKKWPLAALPTGWTQITGDSNIAAAIQHQPIAVYITVCDDFQFIGSDVYVNYTCSSNPADVNHAITVVGWGDDETHFTAAARTAVSDHKYWIIKNSWDTDVGDHGYYRIYRDTHTASLNGNGMIAFNAWAYSVVL